MLEASRVRRWDDWNRLPHPDGMAVFDPDGFRHGRPVWVRLDEFDRARHICTLIPRLEAIRRGAL